MTKRGPQATADTAVRDGFALHQAGDLKGAERQYRRALKRNKHHADALYLLGSVQVQTGDLKKAEKTLQAALAVQPDKPDALHNLARVMMDTDRFAEAEPLLEKALARQPEHPSFLRNLGVVRLQLGKPSAAADVLGRATAVDPSSAETWCDLGMALSQSQENARAEDAFERALTLEPDHPRARHNRGHLRLRQKNFAQGWSDYEFRRTDPRSGFEPRPFDLPWWSGEDLSDQTLLVWGEQGLGDQILHAGLLPGLMQQCGHVVFECEPRLVPLMARSFPSATVVATSLPPRPDIAAARPGMQTASGSLGQWLRRAPDSFVTAQPSLKADDQKTDHFKRLLQHRLGTNSCIGISWKSARVGFGAFKSSELSTDWKPVFASGQESAFVSLQYGEVSGEVETCRQDLGVDLHTIDDLDVTHDLDGLAALIAALDLVITTSNTTAHLAGALGVPTWVLVPRGPAQLWYWFDGDEKSLWYPHVTLYWQETAAVWDEPMIRVSQDLGLWLHDKAKEAVS